jgi:hypothetical protein
MKSGDRLAFHNLLVTKVSSYNKLVRPGHSIEVYRYAFTSSEDNARYVYSGVHLGLNVRTGEQVSLRATVKLLRDEWGFTRLQRVELIGARPPQLF